ncbi:hypothetical protein M8J75_001502 [Diaphorina citri]|nr:hypothetical protein M8J75_001502 [Diaphorina citri]KAI5725479.1 hypothetical protein M8J77_015997 [Diaphorina citri]KAI5726093.1 hypothetical protein M8J77_023697 [Diaphorina citri]
MGSHKKHKYYKKKSKKSKKHKKPKINLKEIHDKLKSDKKYSNLISALSIKDKRSSNEKRSRSESSDNSSNSLNDGTGRRKIKYKYKKSRSSSMTSSSSSTSSYATSSSSSSPSSSSSSDEKQRKAKHKKKKLKKDDKKKKIELLNRKHEENKKLKIDESCSGKKNNDDFNYDKKRIKKIKLSNDSGPGPAVPDSVIQKSKAMAPMSKEEWEKKQNEIRRVYDQETGRYRLIKGDGEVLEEIVSRSRHREINKQATAGDGNFFQTTLASQIKK